MQYHSSVNINGKIRAREVRVIGVDGKQFGILSRSDALKQARAHCADLVEIAPTAKPPVCRLVPRKKKETNECQDANKVKKAKLSPRIDLFGTGGES